MAMKASYAKILVGMMPPEYVVAFRFICGKNDMAKAHATDEVIEGLVHLELVRRCKDGDRELVLLTPRGKQLAKYV
jgi:hypothetical protein